MQDIECPYCEQWQEINHDDGYGWEEDVVHQQDCSCGKTFTFTTSISYYYEAEKAECLNGGDHDFKPTTTYPREESKMECSMCEERREPTEEEMGAVLGS